MNIIVSETKVIRFEISYPEKNKVAIAGNVGEIFQRDGEKFEAVWEEEIYTVSRCHTNDEFDKRKGQKISLARFLSFTNLNKAERKLVWEIFLRGTITKAEAIKKISSHLRKESFDFVLSLLETMEQEEIEAAY